MRNEERVERFRKLSAQIDDVVDELSELQAEANEIVATGKCEPAERADEIIERHGELLAERNRIVTELRKVDPALRASSN